MTLQENILAERQRLYNISNSAGASFSVFDNGEIADIKCGRVNVNLISGTAASAGPCNIYLRKTEGRIKTAPLIGSTGCGRQFIDNSTYYTQGRFEGIEFKCRLLLDSSSNRWLWFIRLTNISQLPQRIDLLATQDVGLSCADGNEKNDFYISQYIDYRILQHGKHGCIVCCRQNEHAPAGQFPWLALGCIDKASNCSTDGSQFYGTSCRATAVAEGLYKKSLGGLLQRQFGLVALQSEEIELQPGQSTETGFFAIFDNNHSRPSSIDDLQYIDIALEHLKQLCKSSHYQPEMLSIPCASLFSASPMFASQKLSRQELCRLFGKQRYNAEFSQDNLLSFFDKDGNHIVLGDKEFLVSLPHGDIMKTGSSLIPDDSTVSCSCFMSGIFISHLAQGNVNFNRFLTVNTNAFNLLRHTGQRIFIYQDDSFCQLSTPSAFEMSKNKCRWIYKSEGLLFEIICRVADDEPSVYLEMNILEGTTQQWLISSHLSSEPDWHITKISKSDFRFTPSPASMLGRMFKDGSFDMSFQSDGTVSQTGSDELIFDDGLSRDLKFFVIGLEHSNKFQMRIDGRLVKQTVLPSEFKSGRGELFSLDLSKVNNPQNLQAIKQVLPWFEHNAEIHYLTPHGLEQYGGAAWGTRDICQGPVEMLLAQGKYSAAKKILSMVFANQNSDGNWPQWWMFDRYKDIRACESHGDVIFWPILAVSEYIAASGDYSFLQDFLPYSDKNVFTGSEQPTVLEHIFCAIEYIKHNRFASGTMLVNYSDGDWNDAMQPVSSQLKRKLISSWTVELSYQTFKAFADVCIKAGKEELANRLQNMCVKIREDFNKFLIRDDVVCGFAIMQSPDDIKFLLHPSDETTGIHYRLLPMIRGIISGIFTTAQVHSHLHLIEKKLKAPDGARLMDVPAKYNGGIQKFFKRAESSPYFGREIGIMYMHAHLRYAQSLAELGLAEPFVKALRQAVPVDIHQVVSQADIRQSNCYYSSSDGDFTDRYQAARCYGQLKAGKVKLCGGWRIYSSGPGMFVNFVISYLLGIRHHFGSTVFDPVMPSDFDALSVDTEIIGKSVKIIYSVSGKNSGLRGIEINGTDCRFTRADNNYRLGGAVISDIKLSALLSRKNNIIKIYL